MLDFEKFTKDLESVALVPSEPLFVQSKYDKTNLHIRYYSSNNDQGKTLVFLHGGGANMSLGYFQFASQLLKKNKISVCLVDLRGHGKSGGNRGDADSSKVVWQDIDDIIIYLKEKIKVKTIYIGGHSSGAGCCLNYLTRYKYAAIVKGGVFIAPELGPFVEKNSATPIREKSFAVVKHKVWFVIHALTNGLIGGNQKVIHFPMYDKFEDKLGLVSSYTVNMANAVTPRKPLEQLRSVNIPIGIFIAKKDGLFNCDQMLNFIQSAQNQNISTFVLDNNHLDILLNSAGEVTDYLC